MAKEIAAAPVANERGNFVFSLGRANIATDVMRLIPTNKNNIS